MTALPADLHVARKNGGIHSHTGAFGGVRFQRPRWCGPGLRGSGCGREWFYCLAGEYVVEIGDQRFRLGPGDSVLGPRRVPYAFVYDGAGPGRILIGFTPAVRIEQFFRDLEKRGEYFGNGSPEDKELVHRLYGIVNVGPTLKL